MDDVVSSTSLQLWCQVLDYSEASKTVPDRQTSKFPFRDDINSRISLWKGPLPKLEIEAVVCISNENLSERDGVSARLFAAAGPKLEEEISFLDGCRTGEAKSTNAYNLPAKRIIHTVGPRYNEKYRTAAENALCSCYRSCMQLMVEDNLRSIAFPCVHSDRKGYATEAGAHIAIRTLRRFLEAYLSKVDRIVLVMDTNEELSIYSRVLPLYFPRSQAEEQAAIKLLPEDTGNEVGETSTEERKIRVSAFGTKPTGVTTIPSNAVSTASTTTAATTSPTAAGPSDSAADKIAPVLPTTGFTDMRGDVDAERKAGATKKELTAQELERQYQRLLRRARSENLTDIADLNFLYLCGVDNAGRPVVCVVARHLPANRVDLDRVLLYLLKTLDQVVEKEYVIVYFHSNIQSENKPDYSWFKKVFNVLPRKYRKNVRGFYIVHPTFWVKAAFFFLRPFISEKFWNKLFYIDTLSDLFRYVPREQITLPKFVIDFDIATNGVSPATTAGSSAGNHDAGSL